MVCLYPAAKAMMKALKTLNETRDVMSLGNMGTDWVVFNEIVGLDTWRRRELELSTRGVS